MNLLKKNNNRIKGNHSFTRVGDISYQSGLTKGKGAPLSNSKPKTVGNK